MHTATRSPARTLRCAPQREADVSHATCASPFFTVAQFARRNPVFSLASLRWMIFHRDTNGLQASGAILRNGRAIVIDEQRFFDWFRARGSR